MTDGARLDAAGRLLERALGLAPPTLDEGRRTLVMPVAGGASRLTETLRVLDGTADRARRRRAAPAHPGRRVPVADRAHATEDGDGGTETPRNGDSSSPEVSRWRRHAAASVVAKRNVIKIKRVPDLLVFTTLSPIMFVLLFAYVFGGAIEGGGTATSRTGSSSSRGSSPRP